MESWLVLARGPIFRACLVFMLLGLARQIVISAWQLRGTLKRAGDRVIPYGQVLRTTLEWLFPVRKIGQRPLYSLTTLSFHVAVIVVPIFLAGHVALWKAGLGLSWPAISNGIATALTIVATLTALLLVVQRAIHRDSRALSTFQDYAVPLVIAVPFVTGFLIMHPAWNPFAYDATMFVHVMSANLVLVLIPLTKLSHMALLPAMQLVSEVAWHFPPDAGAQVGLQLNKGDEPV
jgi:nitrate reductase gamma subunit